MSEHIVRIRRVAPEELFSEESVLQKDPDSPFLSPGDHPEPYRTQCIAAARRRAVLQQEKLKGSPLVVNTPRGQALVWRWWPGQMGVVLLKPAITGSGLALEESVTFLSREEQAHVTVDLTQLVLNPPNWS